MILSSLLLSLSAVLPFAQDTPDPAPVVRRIAATALLAAQEYRLGVAGGRIVARPEVDEAILFLEEARRTADLLPPEHQRQSIEALDAVLTWVRATGEPDSVTARVQRLTMQLSRDLGVDLAEVPASAPSLAEGARVYQAECTGCHGTTGRGLGSGVPRLDPPPADLTDWAALLDRAPLDFYRRVTLGVAGTAMPSFESTLTPRERWAVSVYASVLRLPPPAGDVPLALGAFSTSARMSDAEVLAALGIEAAPSHTDLARLAAVRSIQHDASPDATTVALETARARIDSAMALAQGGQIGSAQTAALDAYMAFEEIERALRPRDPGLVGELEAAFAAFRGRLAGATPTEREALRADLMNGLERVSGALGGGLSSVNLFVQSLVIMLREGLEAILIVGALVTFLLKTGAPHRRREVHIGVGAALVASALTAVALETVFQLSMAHQEMLEGFTMLAAMVVLFYVSYWLLSKLEVAKWNRFVKGKVQEALVGGSLLALPSVAFLAVYREGFETVLFYKALMVSAESGVSALVPVTAGILVGSLALVAVYIGMNRYGVRIPLKPFFAITSAFLLYMAFVFAGKGVAELQGSGLIGSTIVSWAPRIPVLGVYPTLESLVLQGVLLTLIVAALAWTFVLEPRRLTATRVLVPDPQPREVGSVLARPSEHVDLLRSLSRMDADLAELRAEIARIKDQLSVESAAP